jgi:hypothetical protein
LCPNPPFSLLLSSSPFIFFQFFIPPHPLFSKRHISFLSLPYFIFSLSPFWLLCLLIIFSLFPFICFFP